MNPDLEPILRQKQATFSLRNGTKNAVCDRVLQMVAVDILVPWQSGSASADGGGKSGRLPG